MLVKQEYINPLECTLCPYAYACNYGNCGEELYNKGCKIKKDDCMYYSELKKNDKIIYSKRRNNYGYKKV